MATERLAFCQHTDTGLMAHSPSWRKTQKVDPHPYHLPQIIFDSLFWLINWWFLIVVWQFIKKKTKVVTLHCKLSRRGILYPNIVKFWLCCHDEVCAFLAVTKHKNIHIRHRTDSGQCWRSPGLLCGARRGWRRFTQHWLWQWTHQWPSECLNF